MGATVVAFAWIVVAAGLGRSSAVVPAWVWILGGASWLTFPIWWLILAATLA